MFKHILLPTDGSEEAMRAVDIGLRLAASVGAAVHAFHVVAPFSTLAYMVMLPDMNQQYYAEEAEERAREYLRVVEARAATAGVPCTASHVTDDRPHRAIVAAAQAQACDLIVMGSHGWRGMNRLLLGSETQKVLLSCNVPVLVCR